MTKEKLVQKEYVNYGKVFGHENWYVFYCGRCQESIYCEDEKCKKCGAVFEKKVKPLKLTKI